jgi:hypothetical protein
MTQGRGPEKWSTPANRRSITASGINPLISVFNLLDRSIRLENRPETEEGIEMRKFGFATLIASGLTAAVLGFAGPAQADIVTTPTLPHYSVDNHDEANTTNGFVDRAF